MAPARKKRQNEYFDVGVQGRRTGLTLPENTRDSFGVENIDGVFSSPEKSPAKPIPTHGNITLSSLDMDVADDSAPDPTQFLDSRKVLRSTRSTLPPPSARSPFKTNIGSSPRRRSSIAPQTASKKVTRKLDFRADEPRPSIERPEKASRARINGTRDGSADVYSMRPTPPSKNKRSRRQMEEEHELETEEGAEEDYPQEESLALLNDGYEDDDMEQLGGGYEMEETNGEVQSSPIIRKKRRTNGVDSSLVNGDGSVDEEDLDVSAEPVIEHVSEKKKKGRPRRSDVSVPAIDEEENESSVEVEYTEPEPKPTKGRKGATKPAAKATKTSNDKQMMPPPPPPNPQSKPIASRSKSNSSVESTSEEPAVFKKPAIPTKKTNKGVLAEKDPNTSAANSKKSLWAQQSKKPGARSLQIMDQNEPGEEANLVTRSGRRSIRPLEHWRNEQIQYAWDGEAVEVLRAPSEEPSKPRTKKRGSKKTKSSKLDAILEDGVELEDWEADGSILTGAFKEWDNESNYLIPDADYELEFAHGANSVPTQLVVGANFKFGKIMNLPFFGAGIVEIPPQGFKNEKNSRKNHMVFFIETGKVEVTVGDNEFTISKGGCWQVPRGTEYSMSNPEDQGARIFFAQACERVYG